MQWVYQVSPLVGLCLNLVLAYLVVRQRPLSYLNRVFTVFLLSMGGWAFTIFGMRISPTAAAGLNWEKAVFAILPIVSISFFHSVLLLTGARRTRPALTIAYLLAIVFIIIMPSDLVIAGMRSMWYGHGFIGGPLLNLHIVIFYGLVVLSIITLIRAYRRTDIVPQKNRYMWVAAGAMLCLIGLFFDIIAARGVHIYPLGIIGNILFSVLCTYAILKFHLLDIYLVIRRGLAYAVVSAVGIGLVIGIFSFATVVGLGNWRPSPWQSAIAIIFIAIVIQPLLRWIQSYVDRFFYRSRYDYLMALERLSDETKSITDLSYIADLLVKTVNSAMLSRNAALLLPDAEGNYFVTVASQNIADENSLRFSQHSILVWWLKERENYISSQSWNILPQFKALTTNEKEILESAKAELLVPLLTQDGFKGILMLGKKLSETDYSSEEIRMLRVVARQMSTYLDNARLYDVQKRRYQEQAVLAHLRMILASELDLNKLYSSFIQELTTFVPIDYASITLNEKGAQPYATIFTWTALSNLKSLEDKIDYKLIKDSEVHYNPNLQRESFFSADNDFRKTSIRSVLRLMLKSKGGTQGHFTLASCATNAYAEDSQRILRLVSDQLATSIENSRLYEMERHARQELEKEYNERTEFINALIHEVKTPITAMVASSELLHEELQTDTSALGELADNLDSAVHNLDRRITELVSFVKLQNIQTRLNMQVIDIQDIIKQAAAQVSQLLRSKNQTLTLDLLPQPATVKADQDRINQVMLNLLTNASRYSGPDTTITVKIYTLDGSAIIELRDGAPPFEPEELEQLFNPYPRGKHKSSGGLGLGLFICRKLVQLHGGKIWVETDSTGNRFKFSLPLLAKEGKEQ